jgi:plastocyanin
MSRFKLEGINMRSSLLSGATFAVAGALLMISCGGSSGSPTPASPSDSSGPTITVNIGAFSLGPKSFTPNPVQASAGQTVAFKNNDSTTHHIVLDDGSADLGDMSPGATSSTFTVKAGAGNFHCTIHSGMVGAIDGPVPDAPPCNSGPGYC